MRTEALPYGLLPSDGQQPSPWLDRASQIDPSKMNGTRKERVAFLLPNGRKQNVPSSQLMWLATISHQTEDPIPKREWVRRVLSVKGEDPNDATKTSQMLRAMDGNVHSMNRALAPYWGIVDITPEWGTKPHLYRLQKIAEEPPRFSQKIALPKPTKENPLPLSKIPIPPPSVLEVKVFPSELRRGEMASMSVMINGRNVLFTDSAVAVLKCLTEHPRQWMSYEALTEEVLRATKNPAARIDDSDAVGTIAFFVKHVRFVLETITKNPNAVLFDDAGTACYFNVDLIEPKSV